MMELLMMVIAVEAITEILVQGDIFIGIRNKLATINPGFLGKLVGCGYCVSVWVAIPFALAYYLYHGTNFYLIMMIITIIFTIHRLSNLIHELFKRWFDRYPLVFHLLKQDLSDKDKDKDNNESIIQ